MKYFFKKSKAISLVLAAAMVSAFAAASADSTLYSPLKTTVAGEIALTGTTNPPQSEIGGNVLSDVFGETIFYRWEKGKKGEQWNEWFDEKVEGSEVLSVSEKIDKIKNEKKQHKEEEKLLSSSDVGDEKKNEVWKKRKEKSEAKKKNKAESRENYKKESGMEQLIPFTGIADGFVEYNGKYYGTVIEIDPVEFRFFSQHSRSNSIDSCFGQILRSVRDDYAANIIKIERPIVYDKYLEKEYDKLDELRASYENGLLTEAELQSRIKVYPKPWTKFCNHGQIK